MKRKTENWNGHEIRFVEKSTNDWWAVAKDISDALSFRDANTATRKLKNDYKDTHKVRTPSGDQEMLILCEKGIYRLVMRSNKPEAEEFQDWVYEMLKELREKSGLKGFEIFTMLDKQHQKDAMSKLHESFKEPVKVNYIKANTIANKTVSSMFGYPKKLKKEEMTPEMLTHRQPILDDTVELMSAVEKFGLPIKVSQSIYSKYTH